MSLCFCYCCSVIMSHSFRPHALQHAGLLCPPLSPQVCSNSCPLSQWCFLTISSSVIPFSSCPQSFPTSGSFPMSWVFTSGVQNIGAPESVFPMNIQGWFPLRLTGLIAVQRDLKNLLQHNLKGLFLQHSVFFTVQFSHLYLTTWKTVALIRWTFVGNLFLLVFNMVKNGRVKM